MTYFIDQYLDLMLRDLILCPGVDINFGFDFNGKKVYVYIFWHSPSINLSWYPICQIDINDRTVYHREGSENNAQWERFVADAADFLGKAL